MKFFSLLLLLFIFINPVLAKKGGFTRDPFNAKPTQHIVEEEEMSNESHLLPLAIQHCVPEQTVIAQHLSFHQLFVIGVLEQKNRGKVLFKDPQNNVFIATLGDYIGLEQIKLHKIGRRSLEFMRWEADCIEGLPIKIDF